MDKDLILAKLESLRRRLVRITDKRPASAEGLAGDLDRQDIIVVNLERAIQTCVDIGLHLISETERPVPATMGETFRCLCAMGVIDSPLSERLVRAVGFRNTAVHAYQAIDWNIVFSIITVNLDDFCVFAKQVRRAIGCPD